MKHDQADPTPTTLPAPAPGVWPAVNFTDVDAGIQFLTEVLGFVVTVLYRDDNGIVHHAEARRPEGGGIMFGSRGRGEGNHWGVQGPQGVYISTSDAATVDAIHARARAAGLEIIRELQDTDYGSHEFDIRDPDGNLWSIGTYLGA